MRKRSVGLAVGAGGPTGGPFIDAALAVIEAQTGWSSSLATQIVGTSAGAFVAARVRPSWPASDASTGFAALEQHSNVGDYAATATTSFGGRVRWLGGRLVSLLAPVEREHALYEVPEGPYHGRASVVTVSHRSGKRYEHELAANQEKARSLIRASAAIPFLNGPIDIDGTLHIDGAVHSANNVDLLDPNQCSLVVVISPMIPSSGGSKASFFHRAQLFEELRPWNTNDRGAIVVMPNEAEHKNRRDLDFYRQAGTAAAERVFAS